MPFLICKKCFIFSQCADGYETVGALYTCSSVGDWVANDTVETQCIEINECEPGRMD